MCTGAYEAQYLYALFFCFHVDEQPVGTYVALATVAVFAGKGVVSVFCGEGYVFDEHTDDGIQLFFGQMSFARQFQVAFVLG